jgi:hypothetical protein
MSENHGEARHSPHPLGRELACARALLDELETALDAGNDDRTRRDVVVQVAEHLTRLAATIHQWEATWGEERTSLGERIAAAG